MLLVSAALLLAAALSACAGTIDRCAADTSPPAGSAQPSGRN